MILTKLTGGLGNQMFQYSFGRCLAKRRGVGLLLDISAFDCCEKREYMLGNFNIIENIASPKDIARLKNIKSGFVRSVIRKLLRKDKSFATTYVCEKDLFQFDDDIFQNTPEDVYLEGSWQNENYFKVNKNILLTEFTPKRRLTEHNKELLKLISSCDAVSVHVRRGDYITEELTNKFHGVCSLDYYHNAFEIIKKRVVDPYFFVFSDDPQWVRDNLKIPYPSTFVDINHGRECYCDIVLMSHCTHHIIANSTFSWWGAWLSQNLCDIVIAPSKWLLTDKYDTSDLLPSNWLTI